MAMFALLRASEDAVAQGEHMVVCPGGVGLARALAFYLHWRSSGASCARGGVGHRGYMCDEKEEAGYTSDDEGDASNGEPEGDDFHTANK